MAKFTVFPITLLLLILSAAALHADDPTKLAEDFKEMANNVSRISWDGIKGDSSFSTFQRKQKQAIPFYQDFLAKHPESVYSNKVRWALYSAQLSLNHKKEANQTLDSIQDALLQDFLKVLYAQMEIGEAQNAGQIFKGILDNTKDGGVRARMAQFLWVTRNREQAVALVDEVIGNVQYANEDRAKGLLIKADFYRGRPERLAILETLTQTYPNTPAGQEAQGLLNAARLQKGSPALPFTVTTVAGKELSLKDFQGKGLLVVFWGTFDYPSWKDHKAIDLAVKSLGVGRMSVISVACESYVDRPKSFLASQKLKWHLVAEGNKWHNTLAKLYDIKTIPSYILIDRQGRIVVKGTMKTDALIKALPQALAQ